MNILWTDGAMVNEYPNRHNSVFYLHEVFEKSANNPRLAFGAEYIRLSLPYFFGERYVENLTPNFRFKNLSSTHTAVTFASILVNEMMFNNQLTVGSSE